MMLPASGILASICLIARLGKIRIALLVALSTATGYILASGRMQAGLVVPVGGVLFLALGSGALNQYQERFYDARMPRTARRPIPAGEISPRVALIMAFSLMIIGAVILLYGTTVTAFLLGILTVLWYNGVYTYLKRIISLAVIPGSVIGALPPLIGWAAIDTRIFSARPLALALFFFIWQIPHFWLLLLNFGQDYQKAGYPSLTEILDNHRLGRLTFSWVVATAVSLVFMPLFGFGNSLWIYVLLFISAALLIFKSRSLLKINISESSYRTAFHSINLFILMVMFLLTVDRLLNT